MTKRLFAFILLGTLVLFSAGCSLLSTALSAAAAYGIYQATRK